MVTQPGLDKLNLELEARGGFNPEFRRIWNSERHEKELKIIYGGMYEKVGDLRAFGIDARLSCGNRFHPKAGPKLEIFKVGEKSISDIVEIHERVGGGDVWKAQITRVDLTADFIGVGVDEFERSMYLRYGQTTQDEYGKYNPAQMERAYRRGKAETVYFNRRDGQVRIYNKTEHRKVLLAALNRKRRRFGEPEKTFIEEYGYDPSETHTRVEKQCGGRLPEKLWGIRELGQIHHLADVRPFDNFKFASDGRGDAELAELAPMTRSFILALREMAIGKGVAHVRMFLKQSYGDPRQTRLFIQKYEHLFMPQTHLNRETLNEQYRRSIVRQLAA